MATERFAILGVMATVPIVTGSFAGLPNFLGKEQDVEKVSFEEAKRFPLVGSAALFGLFLLLKYLPAELVSLVISSYFALQGCFAIAGMLHDLTCFVAPSVIKRVPSGKLAWSFGKHELLSVDYDAIHLVGLAIGIAVSVAYVWTKHWVLNNVLGESFSFLAIKLMALDSWQTGILLLCGLFVYDVFWVFGTTVMVSVARGLDAPIKLVVPYWDAEGLIQFSLLGLGDIVIPGIFVALALRYDYHLATVRNNDRPPRGPFSKVYFATVFVAYVAGLVATVVAMNLTGKPQPALLYLSPACILAALGTARIRGEWDLFWSYGAEAPDDKAKPKSAPKSPKEPKAVKEMTSTKSSKATPSSLSTKATPAASSSSSSTKATPAASSASASTKATPAASPKSAKTTPASPKDTPAQSTRSKKAK